MLELFFYRNPETTYEYEFVTCRCNYKYIVMAYSYFVGVSIFSLLLIGCIVILNAQ